jgi:hypothetical protein
MTLETANSGDDSPAYGIERDRRFVLNFTFETPSQSR